jgi:hypothetical protein
VDLTVVGTSERHRILVADFAAQGPRLHEAQVMRLGRLPLAPKAWLRGHELQVSAIVVARLAQRQGAFSTCQTRAAPARYAGIVTAVLAEEAAETFGKIAAEAAE